MINNILLYFIDSWSYTGVDQDGKILIILPIS